MPNTGSSSGEPLIPHFFDNPSWRFLTGEGLDDDSLAHWHDQLAAIRIAEALVFENAFWDQVAEVRNGADPLTVAAPYGTRGRRTLAAKLLAVAAEEDTRRWAKHAVLNAGVRAWIVDDAPRRKQHINRPDFLALITEGAELYARRGASKCLSCGVQLTQDAKPLGRPARRDYCSAHEEGVPRSLADSHQRSIERTLQYAARALAGCGRRHTREDAEALERANT